MELYFTICDWRDSRLAYFNARDKGALDDVAFTANLDLSTKADPGPLDGTSNPSISSTSVLAPDSFYNDISHCCTTTAFVSNPVVQDHTDSILHEDDDGE